MLILISTQKRRNCTSTECGGVLCSKQFGRQNGPYSRKTGKEEADWRLVVSGGGEGMVLEEDQPCVVG